MQRSLVDFNGLCHFFRCFQVMTRANRLVMSLLENGQLATLRWAQVSFSDLFGALRPGLAANKKTAVSARLTAVGVPEKLLEKFRC